MRFLCFGLILVVACCGCSWSAQNDTLPEALTSAAQGSTRHESSAEAEQHFDFGEVLANGQTLEHRFRVTNPGPRPLRLMGAQALTRCCSSVGPLPGPIPPNASAEIVAQLRAGRTQGSKRVEFLIATDRAGTPVIALSLAATMIPAIEIRGAEMSTPEIPCGKPGTLALSVISRRRADDGFGPPTSIRIAPPAKARFVSPASEEVQGDIIESRRDVEVVLPASMEPGMKRAEFVLLWAKSDHDERRTIDWTVAPAMKATPPVLILDQESATTTREITVESTSSDFHVLSLGGKVAGAGFRPPAGRSQSHRLSVPIDRSASGVSDLRITTDHPGQPVVKVSVLVRAASNALGPAGGGR